VALSVGTYPSVSTEPQLMRASKESFSQPFVRYSESWVLPRGWCSWQLIYSLCMFMEYFPYRDFLSNQECRRIFTPLLYGRDDGQVY
jgi:hypothetical protein